MNKMLLAFNDINESYITDALEYKNKRKNIVSVKWMAAVACVLMVIFAGVVLGTIWNHDGAGAERPQYIHQVGEKVVSHYGTCEYVSYTDSTVTLRIQNHKKVEYTFSIDAYRWINETERITYVATTGRYGMYGDAEVLRDVVIIYIDGEVASTIDVPADGQEHEVVIDFSYLKDNHFEIESSWELIEFGRFGLH